MGKLLVRVVALLVAAGGLAGATCMQYEFSVAGYYPAGTCSLCTIPLGVDAKHIFGYYSPPGDKNQYGYVQTGGSYATIDPFGAVSAFVNGMNRYGATVGGYCPVGCNATAGVHGFLLQGGVYTNIDYPANNTTTVANGINDLGQIVGGYCPGPFACPGGAFGPANHGFLDVNGVFTNLDYPGGQLTQALAINDSGAIVGIYNIKFTGPHGFLYQSGVYRNIDFPGSIFTVPGAINNEGVVAGYYEGSTAVHGFTYQISTKVYCTIDAPGALTTSVSGTSDEGGVGGRAEWGQNTRNFKGLPIRTGTAATIP